MHDDRTHTASRFIPAPPGLVYGALVDPQRLVRWLPPQGATGRIDAFDARPGGRFRITLTFAAGGGKATADTDVVEGRFVELVPGERVRSETTFRSDDPSFAGTMTMTWELATKSAGTLVTVTARDVPRGISRAEHEKGIASSLDNLAAFLKP